jgi:hypothetical protein
MRYAVVCKPDSEVLDQFIQRKGGIWIKFVDRALLVSVRPTAPSKCLSRMRSCAR